MDKNIFYPKELMLTNVNYTKFEDNIFSNNLVDLEYYTMDELSKFIEQFTVVLSDNNMVQTPELMMAHLYCYFGFLTVSVLGLQASEIIAPQIIKILENQALYSYEQFEMFPLNSSVSQEIKNVNLEKVRAYTPSSIVAQTVRIGRVIFDSLNDLVDNSKIKNPFNHKQEELFCPQNSFLTLLRQFCSQTCKTWEDDFEDYNIVYAINQLTIQIGWLTGYMAHLNKTNPSVTLQYLPCFKMYIEFGHKFGSINDTDWTMLTNI